MKLSTSMLHVGLEKNEHGTCSNPLYMSSAYQFANSEQAANRFALKEGGPIYTRITNPSQSLFEERLGALEGGVALATSSGSSAVLYSILALAHEGDTILAAKNVYGGTYDCMMYTLPKMGIKVTLFDPMDIESFKEVCTNNNAKLVFFESAANPNCDICDIQALVEYAHTLNIPVICDNTFAPVLCKPFKYGVDVIVHSCTKFICGNGSTMGGAIIENSASSSIWRNTYLSNPEPSYHNVEFLNFPAPYTTYIRCCLLRDTGACISPFNAWLLGLGLETLPLRMEKHSKNASELIFYLRSRGLKVNHGILKDPIHYHEYFDGIVSIFTVEVGETKEQAQKFCESLKYFLNLANVGDAKSLVTHPATTTHSQLTTEQLASVGITPTTVRISVGIEDVDDLKEDIRRALNNL